MSCSPAGFEQVHDMNEPRRAIFHFSSHMGGGWNGLLSWPWGGLKPRHKGEQRERQTPALGDLSIKMTCCTCATDAPLGQPPKTEQEMGLDE